MILRMSSLRVYNVSDQVIIEQTSYNGEVRNRKYICYVLQFDSDAYK